MVQYSDGGGDDTNYISHSDWTILDSPTPTTDRYMKFPKNVLRSMDRAKTGSKLPVNRWSVVIPYSMSSTSKQTPLWAWHMLEVSQYKLVNLHNSQRL